MRKPALVRAIYAELRHMLGEEHAAVDVLKMADLLVSSYVDPPDELLEYGVAQEGRPFVTLPVDEAMNDGGWRILAFENKRRLLSRELDDPNSREMMQIARALNHYLGCDWRNYDWIGHGLSSHD
jgi:hypothetical protein